MTSRKTDLLQKIFAAAAFIALGVFLVLLAFQKQHWDADIFWALESGRWIAQNLKVPDKDIFSYTFGDRPWVDFTWGFQIIAHLFKSAWGWGGLSALQLLLTVLAFIVVCLNAGLVSGKRLWLAVFTTFLVFAASYPRLFIRPHLFAYLFISLYIYLLNLHEKRGRAVFLYMLLPLQALWVNVHSSAILGIFITGAYAAGAVVDNLREKGLGFSRLRPEAARLAAVSVLLPAAGLLNPYGPRLVVFPFIHQGIDNADALRHIGEWSRPAFKELFFYFYPDPIYILAFKIFAAGVVLSLVLNFRSIRARDIIILAGSFYMALSHVRWVQKFAFFAAPVLAANLACWLDSKGRPERAVKWAAYGVCVFLAIFVAKDIRGRYAEFGGIGIKDGIYPQGTVEFMKRESVRGNVYNEYDFGGYLIHAYPEVKVFIDGRTPTVYSPYFYWKARVATSGEKTGAWKTLEDEYGLEAALVMIDEPFCERMLKNEGWSLVSFDDVSALFLKRTAANNGIISRFGVKELNPCASSGRFKPPDDEAVLKTMRDELKRLPAVPGVARPHRLLGLVDTKLGADFLAEAAEELKKAAETSGDANAYYDYGVALGKLKKRGEAIEAFMRAGGSKDALLGLGLAYYDMKDYGKAVSYLERYAKAADDSSEYLGYKTLGMAYFESSRFAQAAVYLKRAAFMNGDQKEYGSLYYHIASSAFETGDRAEAVRYYKMALEADPGYGKVLNALAQELERAGKKDKALAIRSLDFSKGPTPD